MERPNNGFELPRVELAQRAQDLIWRFRDIMVNIPEVKSEGRQGRSTFPRGETRFSVRFQLHSNRYMLSIIRLSETDGVLKEEGCKVSVFCGRSGVPLNGAIRHWEGLQGGEKESNSNNQTAIENTKSLISQLK